MLNLSETITIVVCNEEKTKDFTLHTSFATGSSKFIRAALAGDWKEASEKRITIPGHELTAFEGYLNWVHSGQITISSEGNLCEHCAGDVSNEPDCIDARSLYLANMFILGDYLGDAQFCNAIMNDFKSMALKDKC